MNTCDPYHKTFWHLVPLLLLLSLLALPAPNFPAAHAAGPYVVDITSDGPDSDLGDGICYEGVNGCSLRAAIQQASADGAATTITFDPSLAGSTLLPDAVYGPLIWAGSGITVDGEGRDITLSGQNLSAGQSILQIQGNNNTVRYLTLRNAPGDGLQVGDFAGVGAGNDNSIEFLTVLSSGWSGIYVHGATGGGQGNSISNCGVGAFATDTACSAGNTGDGIYLDQLALDTAIYNNDVVCNGGEGIKIDGQGGSPTGVVIQFNLIGTTGTTATAMGNGFAGILDVQSSGTLISGNSIVANGEDGIELSGSNSVVVTGNSIGVALSTIPLPNGFCGVTIIDAGQNNRVGGFASADSNLISANKWSGVCLEGGSTGNLVDGNLIGTNWAGTAAIPNVEAGVYISASDNNTIGSNTGGVVQLISGNDREGIYVENASGNQILSTNYIGVASDLSTPLGNGLDGILLSGTTNTFVEAGIIAHNGGAGVALTGAAASDNNLTPNNVHANGGLPIDLGADGPTANDAGDGDSGPNGLLNYPEITGGSGNTANGTACSNCTVFVYEASGDPRAAGGGGLFLLTVVADGSGSWSAALPGGLTASDVTAVACAAPCGTAANTSEMSPRWGVQVHEVFLPLVVRP